MSARFHGPGPVLLVVALAALAGCRDHGATGRRLEASLAPTFANLVRTEAATLHRPLAAGDDLEATAACDKVGSPKGAGGSGDWRCSVQWRIPGQRAPVHDAYDVTVTSNGCYTATVEAGEARLGGPTLTLKDGTTRINLLYAFDGCFDPT